MIIKKRAQMILEPHSNENPSPDDWSASERIADEQSSDGSGTAVRISFLKFYSEDSRII